MRINDDPELKEAILGLPPKEKDKMLLRLISKDAVLINQLHFRLLEDETDLHDRQQEVRAKIERQLELIDAQIVRRKYAARNLLSDLKSASGIVNEHVRITNDKTGEIDLRLYILEQSVMRYGKQFMAITDYFNERLLTYQAMRLKTILEKYHSIHEDLQFDFRERLNEILHFAFHSAIKADAVALKLPREV